MFNLVLLKRIVGYELRLKVPYLLEILKFGSEVVDSFSLIIASGFVYLSIT